MRTLFVTTVVTFKVYQGLAHSFDEAKSIARAQSRCRFRRSTVIPDQWDICSGDWSRVIGTIREVEVGLTYSNGLDGRYPGGRS